jgi:hypothetical protein
MGAAITAVVYRMQGGERLHKEKEIIFLDRSYG